MAERAHPEDLSFQGTIDEERVRERYAFTLPFIQGKDVLDAPCGTGWGTSLLEGAASRTGIDIDTEAIAYARKHFPGPQFVEGTLRTLPFENGSFDVVICLEGLEHLFLSDAMPFLAESHRVLRPEGLLIVTAPLLRGGLHSGNPYHMYEFAEDELRSLLAEWFSPLDVQRVDGPDGPELRFVGQRMMAPSRAIIPNTAGHSLAERAMAWTLAQRSDSGFRFASGHQSTLLATCFGVLSLEGLGGLRPTSEAERAALVASIQSMQRPEDGIFVDPLLDLSDLGDGGHDVEYLLHQMSYFALHALDALGGRARYPIAFVEAFEAAEPLRAWLEGLDWSNAWLQSNRVMFVLFFLIYRVEAENNAASAALVHEIIDWLDSTQDADTGLWGIERGSSPLNAMAAAYHFLPFYDYLRRPISRVEAIIDATLALQQGDGLFAAGPGGGACEDLDAIDVLAICGRMTTYRQDDIRRALVRAFWALWNAQNDDGGFGYAVRTDGATYRFSSWAPMEQELRHSDAWATWGRLLALATIQQLYPNDLPSLPTWCFRRWPALGYHRFDGQINDGEAKVLARWLRPLPEPISGGGQEPRVSVVVPCYNLGLYLHEALASVLSQTLQSVEVIVVDDGSTDPFTRLVLDSLNHPQVRILRLPNRGLPVARNAGIQQAKAAAICCLDADDRLRQTFLERALTLLDADARVGFVSCFIQEFDGRSGQICYPTCDLPEMLYTNRAVVASLFRRQAWEDAGGYCEELTGMHDWDIWIGILAAGYRGAVVPEALFEYRIRPGSMYTKTRRPENYARLFGQIFVRHADLYANWKQEVIVGQARMFAELVEYAEGQAILARSRQQPGQNENLKLIEDARDFYVQQAQNWEAVARQYEEARDYYALKAQSLDEVKTALTETNNRFEELQKYLFEIQLSRSYRFSLVLKSIKNRPFGIHRYFKDIVKIFLTQEFKNKLKDKYYKLLDSYKSRSIKTLNVRNKKWPSHLPLISIVIPCYNYGRYIDESIESIFDQTFQDFEIVIVDGGSNDSLTLGKLKSLNLPKTTVYFREGRHLVGDNRNYGIQRARGKYICCLDPDDLIRPTYLEKGLFIAETYKYDIVYPSVQCFEGSDILWTVGKGDILSCAEENTISTVAIFRKEAWERVKGFKDWGLGENHVPEDWEFWTRLLGHGFRAKRIAEPLMMYRVHGAGLTANNRQSLEAQKRAIKKANQELFDERNIAKLRKLNARKFVVENPFINLKGSEGSKKGVLFALPFMITGGADNILLQIAKSLKEKDFELYCLTSIESEDNWGDNTERYEKITKRIYHLPKFLESREGWKEFLFYLIEVNKIDIIFIVGCEFVYNILPEIKVKFPKVKIIDQLFNEYGHIHNNRKYSKLIDVNIVANNKIQEVLISDHCEDNEKIKVIIHGVDVNGEYNPATVKKQYEHFPVSIPDNKFIIGYFGRFSEEKAPDILVEIAKGLEKYDDIYFVMTGNGPEFVSTKKKIQKLGLADRFYTPGFVENAIPYLIRTDVLIIPSRIEGIPIILLESLSLGIPVIASSVGGIPSIISDGHNGFLCPSHDVAKYIETVEKLYKDETLRKKISANARDYSECNIDIVKMRNEYLDVFHNVVAN